MPRVIPTVCYDVADLRARLAPVRAAGHRIALVPTMGALHRGHASLIEAARQRADHVVVSIFVNPTQFAPGEDLSTYPRDFAGDCALAGTAGADTVFAPDAVGMYPSGSATAFTVGGPARVGLEDRFRPTHFSGVALVVTKLLLQAQPDLALFGEKDFQQLRVIEQVVRDLDIPVSIVGLPTVREADGLALSSRNRYLDDDERGRAPAMIAALRDCATADASTAAIASARASLEEAGFVVDYLEARHAATLDVVDGLNVPIRLLCAARLGRTRLIDNIAGSRR